MAQPIGQRNRWAVVLLVVNWSVFAGRTEIGNGLEGKRNVISISNDAIAL